MAVVASVNAQAIPAMVRFPGISNKPKRADWLPLTRMKRDGVRITASPRPLPYLFSFLIAVQAMVAQLARSPQVKEML